ncbi:hypothetical protein C7974DRAFT_411394 [Boeremia exigua]|uniref:uncharacterized protein n=1 Tax=Boeremia exigua TaxID=749465 RepID=UPI001E8CBB8B|nr:uncharacterized protein C7974DRAFT_411394 [Boeremia exigua]KAH6637938.1 hypothetical protein C7974DRAFT_411394 [Boeremia exigua]
MAVDLAADRELLITLLTVAGIILLQILLVIAYLAYLNWKGKAKWRRLSERGIVVINGPAFRQLENQVTFNSPVRLKLQQRKKKTSLEGNELH